MVYSIAIIRDLVKLGMDLIKLGGELRLFPS